MFYNACLDQEELKCGLLGVSFWRSMLQFFIRGSIRLACQDGARPFRPVSSSASRERSLRVWSLGAGGEEVRQQRATEPSNGVGEAQQHCSLSHCPICVTKGGSHSSPSQLAWIIRSQQLFPLPRFKTYEWMV